MYKTMVYSITREGNNCNLRLLILLHNESLSSVHATLLLLLLSWYLSSQESQWKSWTLVHGWWGRGEWSRMRGSTCWAHDSSTCLTARTPIQSRRNSRTMFNLSITRPDLNKLLLLEHFKNCFRFGFKTRGKRFLVIIDHYQISRQIEGDLAEFSQSGVKC